MVSVIFSVTKVIFFDGAFVALYIFHITRCAFSTLLCCLVNIFYGLDSHLSVFVDVY